MVLRLPTLAGLGPGVILRGTLLPGAAVIEIEEKHDLRGFFARIWSEAEFAAVGVKMPVAACNLSFNTHRGTLRGMHYQEAPYAEAKIVRCTRGAIYDVALDLRSGSPTFCRWHAEILTAENRLGLLIPEGFAHGFQTLEPASEVLYLMSADQAAGHARGVRWDDPCFGIDWPEPVTTISGRDAAYPDFAPPERPEGGVS